MLNINIKKGKKMKKGIKISIIVGIMFLFAVTSSSGFGIPKIPGKSEAQTSGASSADVLKNQDALVLKHMEASGKIAEAQSLMAEALGLKEARDKAEAARKALSSPNVMAKGEIKKQKAISDTVPKRN